MENSILQEQALASQLAAPPSDLVTLLSRRIGPINCHKRLWLTSTSINQASSPRIDQPVSFFCLDQRAWANKDCAIAELFHGKKKTSQNRLRRVSGGT